MLGQIIKIDCTQFEFAWGKETTYFAGIIKVNDHEVDCDGISDRSMAGVEELVLDKISEIINRPITDDEWEEVHERIHELKYEKASAEFHFV